MIDNDEPQKFDFDASREAVLAECAAVRAQNPELYDYWHQQLTTEVLYGEQTYWNTDPQYADHVLGWDGKQWAYATVERWAGDDGSQIIPAKELLGDLPGLDDPRRPPRCDHTFG